MSVFTLRRGGIPSYGPPVGTTWLFEEDGEWECPVTGTYEIEMHGGGGGGNTTVIGDIYGAYYLLATGGGSGKVFVEEYQKGQVFPVSIGAGGQTRSAASDAGGTTTFGDLSCPGGGGGYAQVGRAGAASGEIASSGVYANYLNQIPPTTGGGLGNVNNPSQTYGSGGGFTQLNSASGNATPGQPGAVIITYLGA